MKNLQRVSLIFMTSFIGLILVLFLWMFISINTSWLNNALKDSQYDELVYIEIQTEIKQVIRQYGLDENTLDEIITIDRVQINLERNLALQEPLSLKEDIQNILINTIDSLGISLTQDVENGITELTIEIDRIFQDRTQFPIQSIIINLLDIYHSMRWFIIFILFSIFGLFYLRLKSLSIIDLKTAIKATILSYIGVLIFLYIVILTNKINLTPNSLAQLLTSFINLFLIRGVLLVIGVIGLYGLMFNYNKLRKLKHNKIESIH